MKDEEAATAKMKPIKENESRDYGAKMISFQQKIRYVLLGLEMYAAARNTGSFAMQVRSNV